MSPTILPGRVASILGRLNGCGGSTGPGASPDVKIVDELVPCPTPRPRISAEVRRDVAGLRGGLRLGLETVAMVETGRVAVEAETVGGVSGLPSSGRLREGKRGCHEGAPSLTLTGRGASTTSMDPVRIWKEEEKAKYISKCVGCRERTVRRHIGSERRTKGRAREWRRSPIYRHSRNHEGNQPFISIQMSLYYLGARSGGLGYIYDNGGQNVLLAVRPCPTEEDSHHPSTSSPPYTSQPGQDISK